MLTRGQVKWFDPKKGYGFVVGPEGQDVFIHYTQIQGEGFRSLKDGEEVDYELIQSEKGWQARSVQRVNPPEPEPGQRAAGSRPVSRSPRNPSAGYTRSVNPPGSTAADPLA